HGNRKDKHKARLRFVMDKYGYDKFVALYREKMAEVKASGPRKLDLREFGPVTRETRITGQAPAHDPEYQAWLRSNVIPQKPDGYFVAGIRVDMGDIKADILRKLARIVRRFGEGTIRTTQRQNFALRWVSREELYPLYRELAEIGMARLGADGVSDLICCPGSATCNLGLCHSRGLSSAITETLEGNGLDLHELKDITVKLSGCTNACGQHPIGHIGLHGAARRNEGKLAPYYQFLVGGRVEEGKTVMAQPYGFVPAKNIPSLVKDFLAAYLAGRQEGENFYDWLERRGKQDVKELVERHSAIPSPKEGPEYYVDWGKNEEYSLAGLGPGECGAGVLDMIEGDLDDAKRFLHKAEKTIEEGSGDPSEDLYRALVLAAKALLVTQGLDPRSDIETFKGFEDKFITTNLVSDRFKGVQKKAAGFMAGLLESKEDQLKGLEYAKDLADTMAALYDSMDDSLKFTGLKKEGATTCAPATGIAPEEIKAAPGGSDVFMDLRGVACPMNYVRAKLRMEEMEQDQTIMLYLDEGAPIQNVPVSLKNDGQEILKLEKADAEYYEVLVKKLA
ncbi:MAG: sulfurtransferase TusA family protein, partial [Nitrospirota bacterium]|nr:sulfurtransferase TusA family protein [Nitrospirota bacterium]